MPRPTGWSRDSRCSPGVRSTTGGPCSTELDLDAVLARAPQLALVDEFAHTNAPGSRHPKRYQDIEELLDAGIDVYTTLNVQHIESYNDVVAQITTVVVKETVPDSVVDQAAEIELVDLPPEELLQRLREGKVYVPATGCARGRAVLPPGEPDRAPRDRPAPGGPAGRRPDARLHDHAGHIRPLAGGRAPAGGRRTQPPQRAAGAHGQATGRRTARRVAGAVHRDACDRA